MAREGAPRSRSSKTEAPSVGTPEVVAQMMQEMDAQPKAPARKSSPEAPKAQRGKTASKGAPTETVKKPRPKATPKASSDSRQTKTIRQGKDSISVQTRDNSPVNISTGDTHNHISGETPYRDYSLNPVYEQAEPIDTAAEPIENTRTKKPISSTHGPIAPNDIPERAKGGDEPAPSQPAASAQPSAPYTPTATLGGGGYGIGKNPGPEKKYAPAASLDTRTYANANDNETSSNSKEDVWMADGGVGLPEAFPAPGGPWPPTPARMAPATEKKFEGLLKNKEDLAEIDALKETLAAAHAKEAEHHTLWRRVSGMFGYKRQERRSAENARAAAYEAWVTRLATHTDSVYGQVEKLSARNQNRLTRYRGLMMKKLVLSQVKALEARKAELMPPKEKWLIQKWNEQYPKTAFIVKGVASTALVTGAMAATGGIAGGLWGVAQVGGQRLARYAAGTAVGLTVAKFSANRMRLLLRTRAGLRPGETRRSASVERIGREAEIAYASGRGDGRGVNAERAFRQYIEAIKKEGRDDLIVALAGATGAIIAGAGVGAGLSYLDSGSGIQNAGKSGAAASTEPDVPPQESNSGRSGAAAATEPDVPPQEYPSSPDSTPSETPGKPGRGGVPQPDTTPPQKDAVPSTPPPSPETPGPGGVPQPDTTPVPHDPSTPNNEGRSGAAASTEPDVFAPMPHFTDPVITAPGQTIWGITEERFTGDSRFDALNRAQKDYFLDEYWKKMQAMGPDELKKMGIKSGNVHKLFAGQQLDFSKLDSESFVQYTNEALERANVLTRPEQESVLMNGGRRLTPVQIQALLGAADSPMPASTPATPGAIPTPEPLIVQAPIPSEPAPTRVTPAPPISLYPAPEPPDLPPLPQPPTEPTPPEIPAANPEELEVERERAGVELAETVRAAEMAPVIEQANALTEGEADRERSPGIERAPADTRDYSAYTGTPPVHNPDVYGGLSESQLEGLTRTQTLNTITDYFGSRGMFIRNEGMAKFSSIAWRDANTFFDAVEDDPGGMASSINMDESKLKAFVAFVKQGAETYNVPTKKVSLSTVLESVVRNGVERSSANTVLP